MRGEQREIRVKELLALGPLGGGVLQEFLSKCGNITKVTSTNVQSSI